MHTLCWLSYRHFPFLLRCLPMIRHLGVELRLFHFHDFSLCVCHFFLPMFCSLLFMRSLCDKQEDMHFLRARYIVIHGR
jgi:hypothetical protein